MKSNKQNPSKDNINNSYIEGDIRQRNDSDIYVTQKNYIVILTGDSDNSVPNLKPLEDILGEDFNLAIDEKGEVIFNSEKMDVKDLEDGAKAFIFEEEEVEIEKEGE
ncbi:hypothetical protein JCM16358_16310 [Halanaerocella petrolearia]